MENRNGYRKLVVWQKADELAFQIYLVTKEFPRSELFGLTSQMRRSAVSIPANIVEGYGRSTKKDNAHFCFIARGSLTELEYYLDFSLRLKYINEEQFNALNSLRQEVGRLLSGYLKFL